MFCCLKTLSFLALTLLSTPAAHAYGVAGSHLHAAHMIHNLHAHQLTARDAAAQPAAQPLAESEQAQFPAGTVPEHTLSPPPSNFWGHQTQCDKNHYTADEVSLAIQAACYHFQNGIQAGMSPYPHVFINTAMLRLDGVKGPYQTFPLVHGTPYHGGHPGADRIIINSECRLAGIVSHSGARSHSGIVPCAGTS